LRSTVTIVAIGVTLSLASAAGARAEMVARSEHGVVPLVVVKVEGLETPVVVARGQVAWRVDYRPALNVRLEEDTPLRIRPGRTPGVPAGTVLFGYQLSTGVAYCQPMDYRSGVSQVQCFRDFDGDGTFDGRYVTLLGNARTSVLATKVHGLEPMAKVRYSPLPTSAGHIIPTAVVYEGRKGEGYRFSTRLERGALSDLQLTCTPGTGDRCKVLGMTLAIRPVGDAISITLIEEAAPDYSPTLVAALSVAAG